MRACAVLVLVALSTACQSASKDAPKQDTTVAEAAPRPVDTTRHDSSAAAGVPAVPGDSASGGVAAADTGVVDVSPAVPRRGGVLFAYARGISVDVPRCTWNGHLVPCYAAAGGVRVTVPIAAEDPARSYALVIDRPGGHLTRQVSVGEREFGRELIFLDPERYALLERSADIVRDARALKQVLSAESAQQRWSGTWRDPLRGTRSSPFGSERFYYPASDSARSIVLAPSLATTGSFGSDTTPPRANAVPGWRHAGIDIAAPRRSVVIAPAAGIVADVGDYVLTGRTLILDHGQGLHSAFFHLDTVLVRKGDVVSAGANIGRVGTSGLTTGPHLHYGTYVHGTAVDPLAWRDMPAFARGDSAAAAGRR